MNPDVRGPKFSWEIVCNVEAVETGEALVGTAPFLFSFHSSINSLITVALDVLVGLFPAAAAAVFAAMALALQM